MCTPLPEIPFALSLCALLDSYFPDKINFFSLDPSDTENNAQVAFETMKNLKLPILFDFEDFKCTKVDDKALLAQLAVLKTAIEKIKPKQATISNSININT